MVLTRIEVKKKEKLISPYEVTLDKASEDMRKRLRSRAENNVQNIEELKKDFHRERKLARERFKDELNRVRQSYEGIIDGKNEELFQMEKKYNKQYAQVEKNQRAEIARIRESYDQTIEEMREGHRLEMRKLAGKGA